MSLLQEIDLCIRDNKEMIDLNLDKDMAADNDGPSQDTEVEELLKMPPNVTETLLPEKPRAVPLEKASLDEVEAARHEEDEDETFTCDQVSYGIGDCVFSSALVAPLVVSVWRGTWGVMELHADMFPITHSFFMGLLLHVSFAVLRSHLLSRASAPVKPVSRSRWILERVISRVYTYVFILANIMHWRGGWGLLDAFTELVVPDDGDPHRPVLIAVILIVLYVTITVLRSSRNLLATPFFLFTDGKEATYLFTTRFNASNSRETALYVLDCIFSVGVIGSLVVFVWRGSWALLDIFLYPDDQVKSCWTSLIVGYGLVVVTFALQGAVRWAAARLHGAARLLLADAYYLMSFCATVNVWRGVWGLLDVYFFPETPKLSNWCSHAVSLTLLVLLNCSNSVLVRGVYIDAEEPAGECVVFPCHYLRLYFHKERTKKRHKQALAAAAIAGNKREEIAASAPLQMHEEKV